MFYQELQGSRLMPAPDVARHVDKSDMTSADGWLKKEVRILFRFLVRERFRSQERIVACVQEQGWNFDPIQILPCARFLPVVIRIAETVERRGVKIVEFPQCTDQVTLA